MADYTASIALNAEGNAASELGKVKSALMSIAAEVAAVAGVSVGFGALITRGIEFNRTMEDSRTGLGALIMSSKNFTDSTGEAASAQERAGMHSRRGKWRIRHGNRHTGARVLTTNRQPQNCRCHEIDDNFNFIRYFHKKTLINTRPFSFRKATGTPKNKHADKCPSPLADAKTRQLPNDFIYCPQILEKASIQNQSGLKSRLPQMTELQEPHKG